MIEKRLKFLRTQAKKRQEDIAEYLGITRPAYTAYESGKRSPDFESVKKIADYYNVSTDYLLGRTDNPTPYDNTERVTTAVADDPELSEFWEELKNRESLQLMFKQVKSMSDSDIKKIMRIIKAIEDEEAGK